ncbi:MAG: DUF2807 domain-containing protein [Pontibacter sp.]|nr:DUF2807 domain-containing protein [Pontibacter sp.]
MKMTYATLGKITKVLLLLSLSALSLTACEDSNCIKGEGDVEVRTLNLQPFTSVEANGDFKVYLSQGEEQKVEVKGEPNILNQLQTNIKNETWLIEHRDCVRRSKPVEVYITIPSVEALYLNGSGGIYSQNLLDVGELPVTVNGSGKIELDVAASKVITRITGSGEVLLQGEVPVHHVNISGSGRAEAFNLQAAHVTVNLSGSGAAEVTALNSLDVTISGSGNVYYKGNPTITQSVSGSGKVIRN